MSPGFVIIEKEDNDLNIYLYQDISFKKISDSIPFLNILISQNLDLVIIEKQNSFNKSVNTHTMGYLQGFFEAKNIEVKIMNPISLIRENKNDKSRSAKKQFSIDLANKLIKFNPTIKDSDTADAVNIALLYLHKEQSSKNNSKNFQTSFGFNIKKTIFRKLLII